MHGNFLKEHKLYLADGDGTGGPGGSPGGAPPAEQEWFTGLPDTLKPDAAVFEPFKDKPVTDVLGAYRDLSKKAADFAVPASPKDYGIALPATLAELAKDPETGRYLNAELERTLADAHAEGLSVKQAQARVERETREFISGLEANKKASAEAMKALETSWGDKFDANKAIVEREIAALPEKTRNAIQKSGMANDPHLMEIFFDLATAHSEGRLRAGGDPGASKKSLSERLYG